MAGAFERWQESQLYETLCLLYVALTRAKRGLYVYLPEEPKGRKEGELFRTPANLVRQSTGLEFPESDPNWTDSVRDAEVPESGPLPRLGEARPQRPRSSPSAQKSSAISGSGSGRKIGSEVHALFEEIEWLAAGQIPRQSFSAAGKIVEDVLKVPVIHQVFEDTGARLYREQSIELILDGKWMSGVVDRLHVSEGGIELLISRLMSWGVRLSFSPDTAGKWRRIRRRWPRFSTSKPRLFRASWFRPILARLLKSVKRRSKENWDYDGRIGMVICGDERR